MVCHICFADNVRLELWREMWLCEPCRGERADFWRDKYYELKKSYEALCDMWEKERAKTNKKGMEND